MAKTYLETSLVNHRFQAYSYENVLEELQNEQSSWSDDGSEGHRLERERIQEDIELLKKYPQEFTKMYAIRQLEAEDNVSFRMHEIPQEESEIVTERQDILERQEQLELECTIDDVGTFGVTVEQFDRAGEDKPQLRGRITFPRKTLDDLNEARLKAIVEFCEKHGFSVYDIDLPMKDGVIDLDEKLAELTQQLLEQRVEENTANPGPEPDSTQEEDFIILDTDVNDVDLTPQKKAKPKKVYTFDNLYNDMVDFLENDIHKTKGLTYFQHSNRLGGRKTIVFSLYDKPNKDNERLDGVKDKNGNYPPTYSYRLYISHDPKTDKFVFGYGTPGGKKMDDVMAGDFIGIIKKTGVTHINFSKLQNVDKNVWMIACAEKGIVPIGISLNMAKARRMVDAAKGKLSTEELMIFKRNLSEQMIENAKKKKPDAERYGIDTSEYNFIMSLRAGYDFEPFRVAFDAGGGLYEKVNAKIDEGATDKDKGAATTLGAMHALRAVFDVYFAHHDDTVGSRINQLVNEGKITTEERANLVAIPSDIKLSQMSKEHFNLMYDTLLPRRIEMVDKDIRQVLAREFNNKVRRAPGVVLGADLFPKAKGAVNGINTILRQEGIDVLTLPVEHSGLYYDDPNQKEVKQSGATQTQSAQNKTNETPAKTPAQTHQTPDKTPITNKGNQQAR